MSELVHQKSDNMALNVLLLYPTSLNKKLVATD